jgi:hypothetical protein
MAHKTKRRLHISNKELQRAFGFLNHKFFAGRLHPTIRVRWADLRKKKANGMWNDYEREIKIDRCMMQTGWNSIYILMLHEMIHADLESASDCYVGYKADEGHGTRFQGEICRLLRAGAYDGLL